MADHSLIKWVAFARQAFALMLISVVTIAGISAIISTKQAQGLLEESLSAQGRAIADALARAAFVPLTLDDKGTLTGLLNSYKETDNVASLRILDEEGKLLNEALRGSAKSGTVAIRSPIMPTMDAENRRPVKPIGFVEVRLWSKQIKAKSRTIAWINVLISGALTILISAVGFFMIRNLVTRMQELVGEARLAEEVKHANAELEAFSYSVSHDLRAPLRAIAGFSQIILEDSAAGLDESGKKNLGRVVAATKLMGNLLDDILELSRVSRTEIQRKKVDLGGLAKTIIKELQAKDPSRRVETLVGESLVANGDPNLLRIALVNLIDNAWKYTGKTANARIEFGASPGPQGEPVFFVKDNGAGFDMSYADKLFGAFQRLHSQQEFPGTGIGLATIQRIVHRHGGRVWAEGAVGKGAVFYFTLNSKGGSNGNKPQDNSSNRG